jgi:hypothetical protein
MSNGTATVQQKDGKGSQPSLPETKRFPGSTKRFPGSTKRFPGSTKWIDRVEKQVDKTDAGGSGDYEVKLADGKKVPVQAAMSIRVLRNGELNFLTDQGHWILFASGTWKQVFPKQPSPGA